MLFVVWFVGLFERESNACLIIDAADRVLTVIATGEHDYNETMEILQQSNPAAVEPVLSWTIAAKNAQLAAAAAARERERERIAAAADSARAGTVTETKATITSTTTTTTTTTTTAATSTSVVSISIRRAEAKDCKDIAKMSNASAERLQQDGFGERPLFLVCFCLFVCFCAHSLSHPHTTTQQHNYRRLWPSSRSVAAPLRSASRCVISCTRRGKGRACSWRICSCCLTTAARYTHTHTHTYSTCLFSVEC